MFVDHNALGIAAIGNAAEVFVRRIESERHVWAELLEVTFAICAGEVGIDHATHRDEIARFVVSNGRTDFGYPADDLMAGDDWVVRRHKLAPFVAHGMKVRVANATKKDFDLHVALSGIASRDCGRGKLRFFTG